MKRFVWGIVGLTLGFALLVVGFIGVGRLYRGQDSPPESSQEESLVLRDVGFIVGVWENKLAVFPAGALEPIEVYEVYIASLPKEEQERLHFGIVAENATQLASLIEDYTG